MKQKESSSLAQWNNAAIETLSKTNQSEQYFKKMVEIKDKNIEDLLKELRQTKEIYHQYKTQYLNEQKKIKAKMTEITAKFDAQSAELQKYQQMNAKLKSSLESYAERQKKMVETHQKQTKQFKKTIIELQNGNKELARQNKVMVDKQAALQQKCGKIEERLKARSQEAKMYEMETKRVREQLLRREQEQRRREQEWRNEKKQLIEKRQQQATRKAAKDRTNCRLDALQSKIKSTLMKI